MPNSLGHPVILRARVVLTPLNAVREGSVDEVQDEIGGPKSLKRVCRCKQCFGDARCDGVEGCSPVFLLQFLLRVSSGLYLLKFRVARNILFKSLTSICRIRPMALKVVSVVQIVLVTTLDGIVIVTLRSRAAAQTRSGRGATRIEAQNCRLQR